MASLVDEKLLDQPITPSILLCAWARFFLDAAFKLPSYNITDIDWKLFARQMQQHKLESVVWHSIKHQSSSFPKSLVAQLKQYKQIQNQRKLRLAQEIWRIQQAFRNEQIPIIPYKGLCLAAQVYPFVQQRETNDIDFAIDRNHIARSAEIMRSLGYVEYKEKSNFVHLSRSRSYHIDYSWMLYDQAGHVICNAEIHWQPANSALYIPFDFSTILQHTTIVKVFDYRIETFDIVHQTLIAIVHHGIVDTWSQLRHLVDFALLLRTMKIEELKLLEELCRHYHLWQCYQQGLYLLETVLQQRTQFVQYTYKNNLYQEQLAQKVITAKLVGHWKSRPQKLYYYLRMRDTWKDIFRSIVQFLVFVKFEFLYQIRQRFRINV